MMSRWTGVYDCVASSVISLTWVRELETMARLQGTRMDLDERKRPRGNDHEREEGQRPDTGGKRRLEEAAGDAMRETANAAGETFHTSSSAGGNTEGGQGGQERTSEEEGTAADTRPIDASEEDDGRSGSDGARPASRPRSQALQQWGTLHAFFGDSTMHTEMVGQTRAGGLARDPPATEDEQPLGDLSSACERDPRLERICRRCEGIAP